jgi:hypothetical protein
VRRRTDVLEVHEQPIGPRENFQQAPRAGDREKQA